MSKVIVRIKGGLGNQLFCYAAARRLALVNNAELVIDDKTGFIRDHRYNRRYVLDQFRLPPLKTLPASRLNFFSRVRRGLVKTVNRNRPFPQRSYLEQDGDAFDQRLLDFKVTGSVYIDGYWQSERYFDDVSEVIRQEFQIIPPLDTTNRSVAEKIQASLAVAIHVRWFEKPGEAAFHNLTLGYYRRAVNMIEERFSGSRYYVFSDNPQAARAMLDLPTDRATFIDHNHGDAGAVADLWLMTHCKHFIIANSTFSWWGAWLKNDADKMVIYPDIQMTGLSSWGFDGLIPDGWTGIR